MHVSFVVIVKKTHVGKYTTYGKRNLEINSIFKFQILIFLLYYVTNMFTISSFL